MAVDESMWTPLEAALSPFKELARLNRQTVIGADGESVQLVLDADRCRVVTEHVELGFALAREPYTVGFAAADYRRDGRWEFSRILSDIAAGLTSGALKSGTAFQMSQPYHPTAKD